MRTRISVTLLAMTLSAAAGAATLLTNIPLQWKPTSDLQSGSLQLTQTAIQFESFQDLRDDKQGIGENDEDDKKAKPVTTGEDVGAFVGTHMRDLYKRAGLNVVHSGGAVIVKGEVRQFYVHETSTYKSEIGVRLTVSSSSGKTLYSGMATGDATRFGRSYKAENYYEVLSDGVVNTVSSTLQDAKFQAALAGH